MEEKTNRMNRTEKSLYMWFVVLLFACFLHPTGVMAADEEPVDVQNIVFSHIKDAYSWHITEWNGHDIAIPLPVIVKAEDQNWEVFSSSRLHGQESYHNYYISSEGDYAGKIVYKNAAGEEVRPWDFSITKNVLALFIGCAILLWVVIGTARWYLKHPGEVPKGFVGLIEFVVHYMYYEVIKEAMSKEDCKRFTPYLLTLFFFILINNVLGVIPIFPGGANLTGNVTITASLAVFTFLATNVFGTKQYWKEIFWPDVPAFLKVPIPIMPFVEFIGTLTKPFSLTIRLFANIMAGHTTILALTCLIFITAGIGVVINTGMGIVSVLFCVFMNCLELFVACLQAYIFMLLSANYIGQARVRH